MIEAVKISDFDPRNDYRDLCEDPQNIVVLTDQARWLFKYLIEDSNHPNRFFLKKDVNISDVVLYQGFKLRVTGRCNIINYGDEGMPMDSSHWKLSPLTDWDYIKWTYQKMGKFRMFVGTGSSCEFFVIETENPKVISDNKRHSKL